MLCLYKLKEIKLKKKKVKVRNKNVAFRFIKAKKNVIY